MVWSIREGTRDDLPALFALEQRCFHDPWSLAMLETEFGHPFAHFRILERRDPLGQHPPTIEGFSLFWIVVDECHLMQIGVSPDVRRQGLGRKLMHDLKQYAQQRELIKIFLEVRASNQAARGLYQNMHFHEIGVRSCYYDEPPEDGIVLECLLETHPPLRG